MDYHRYSDQVLLSLLREDDLKAYAEIYSRFSGVLYAHTLKRLNDREEAKDIVQELYTYLWIHRKELLVTSHLSGYLYKAVRNRVINVIAHREIATRYRISLDESAFNSKRGADDLIRGNQLSELIEKEVDNLPSRMREVFILSRRRHLSHREIAEELSISELTVKKQVTNALKVLRARLDFLMIFITFLLVF